MELQLLFDLILWIKISNHYKPIMTLMHVLLLGNVFVATDQVIYQIIPPSLKYAEDSGDDEHVI